jgi:CRISPR-associated protein Csx10
VRYLPIDLRTLSPLAIRSDHAAEGSENTKYIPGTTFAGSLAAVHRLSYPEATDTFEELFLSGRVLYPDLYPAVFDDAGLQEIKTPVNPLPKTAQSCKRHKGFLFPQNEENEAHGVRDTLFDWAMFKMSSGEQQLQALRRHKNCSCGEPMDHFDGYYRQDDRRPFNMIAAQVEKRTHLRMHTGVNRETGTVEASILYNRRVFDEKMRFWGVIKFADDDRLEAHLRQYLDEVGQTGLVRIGTGRTRGLGKVSFLAENEDRAANRFGLFVQRLTQFNAKLQQQAEAMKIKTPCPFYFALTLHSPTIIQDDLLRYRGTISDKTLENLLKFSVPSMQLVFENADVQRIRGWNEIWGTPRTQEYAISSGSVFLYSCSSELIESALKALFELEEQGIGKRRAEGFGRICISDPFHLEVTLR